MTNGSVLYLGYYSDEAGRAEKRAHAPSAVTKMDYILSALNRAGYAVELVSASHTLDQVGHGARVVNLGNGNTLRFFRTLPWGSKARRIAGTLYIQLSLLLWLLRNARASQNVLVYHSLGYASTIAFAHRVRRFRLILDVAEIYADVSGSRRDRRREARLFERAESRRVSRRLHRLRGWGHGQTNALPSRST